MKRALFPSLLMWLSAIVWASPAVVEATADPMQRTFRFHNELTIPVYPVISAGQNKADTTKPNSKDTNCPGVYGDNTLLRIIVNGAMGRGKGIQPGETVDVRIPKSSVACPQGLFYTAGRVVIFTASPDLLDQRLKLPDYGKGGQATQELTDAWTQNLCQKPDGTPLTGCWGGKATAAYGSDAPGQLTEFTIISQVKGSASQNGPDDLNGTSNIGFNISYVDDAYLPLAMGVAGGTFGYLGSALAGATFNQRLTNFLVNEDWSEFAAWTPAQFMQSTVFGTPHVGVNGAPLDPLVARTDKLPSGDIILKSTRTGKPFSGSDYTFAVWDGVTLKDCQQRPPSNQGCAAIVPPPKGDCCPGPAPLNGSKLERYLGCCDTPTNALIEQVTRTYTGTPPFDVLKFINFNPTLSNIVNRWLNWKNGVYNCANPPFSPVKDQVGFCQAFKRNVDFAWEQLAKNFNTALECNKFPVDSDAYNQCIVAAIVGYDIDLGKTGYVAANCSCPNTDLNKCGKSCTDEIQRTESVQALLRSVPWNGLGTPATCAQCPSADESKCPRIACVAPQNVDISKDANLYQFDKFLHFWAPYSANSAADEAAGNAAGNGSEYNLNPYARFIHNTATGVDALSAYGFSIDDFYGFLGANGTMLVFDVGGKAKLDNRDPRDPYTLYFASMGPGWSKAKVCGREFVIANPNDNQVFPVSFWKDPDGDGTFEKKAFCAVNLYNSKNQHMSFILEEKLRTVTDRLLTDGVKPNIAGLSGGCAPTIPNCTGADPHTWADRGDGKPFQEDSYCKKNSSPELQNLCSSVSLSPHGSNQAYVGIVECPSSQDQTCGRPLMNLNLPGCKGTNQC